MRSFNVHRSSMSRYMGKTSGYKRSSIGRRGSYKLGSSRFESYLLEAKKISDEVENSKKNEEDTEKKSSLSKYTKTKETSYKNSTSKFNTGTDAMESSKDAFAELLKKDEPDMDKAYDAAVKFAEGYNNTYAAVKNSSDKSVSAKAKYISSVTDIYSRSLSKVGITADKDGKISVDKEKFMTAQKSDLEAVFANKGSYASHVTDQTDSIKLLSSLSTETYSSGNSYNYTSAMSGSLFSKRF